MGDQAGQIESTVRDSAKELLIDPSLGPAIPVMTVVQPALVLVGIPAIVSFVSIQTLLQQATEDAYRGRVFGAFGTTITLLMFIGSGIGGALTDQLGAPILMSGAAVFYVIAGFLAVTLILKLAREAVASA